MNHQAKQPAPAHSPVPRGKAIFWAVLLAVALCVGSWGYLNHPARRDETLQKMTSAQLEAERLKTPSDPVALYYLGKALNNEGKFAPAAELLYQAAGLSPDSARIRDEWARAQLNLGQTTPAFGQLKQFIGAFPNSAEGHLALGKFYFAQRAMDKAVAELERAIALQSGLAEAYSFLAAALDALGEFERARTVARRAAQLRPENPGDLLLLASLEERLNQPDEAATFYQRAAANAKAEAAPHREYARWLLIRGNGEADYRKAEQEAREALRLDPDDAASHLHLGRALIRLGQQAGAVEPLQKAAELSLSDTAAPNELANLMREMGRAEEAARWTAIQQERQAIASEYELVYQALRVTPDDPALHGRLAKLMARQGEAEECQRQVAAQLNRPIDSVPVLIAASKLLLEARFARKALPLAFKAVEIGQYSPEAHETLGDVYLALDMGFQAAFIMDKAARLLPSRKEAIGKKLNTYQAMREKNPTPAEKAYRQALSQEFLVLGPQKANEEQERLARQATELDPYTPRYWWYLMTIQKTLKKVDDAVQSGKNLLTIAPDFQKGHALMAVLLVENANTDAQLQVVEDHLKKAAGAPDAETMRRYGLGLLALKRGDGKRAAIELRAAAAGDPGEPITYFKLAQAERSAGNGPAADRALTLFRTLQDDKQAQADAISDIAQSPDDPARYAKAVRLFVEQELFEEASAIRREAIRRFGAKFAPLDTTPIPVSKPAAVGQNRESLPTTQKGSSGNHGSNRR